MHFGHALSIHGAPKFHRVGHFGILNTVEPLNSEPATSGKPGNSGQFSKYRLITEKVPEEA